MGGSRSYRLSRTTRPTALLSAVATLLGALFICLVPAGPHHDTTAPPAYGPLVATAYSCPHDEGRCGLLPVLSPAVLTAPPLDAPPTAGATPPYPGPDTEAGPHHRSGAQARAPDLHVLQVLRT
ncbi:hypothetical protein [Streptomyces peucetius]|uniref:Secreted protein n=1 Tax=Streptomyces peucetius TaxID=1950 RepID=A0ABY6I459_STRPE|nr:hypothetical protein [Streptomyces peucetius]UYQ61766.1 hypothetical protein OGH68_09865 [Streptomyces peucetius]